MNRNSGADGTNQINGVTSKDHFSLLANSLIFFGVQLFIMYVKISEYPQVLSLLFFVLSTFDFYRSSLRIFFCYVTNGNLFSALT